MPDRDEIKIKLNDIMLASGGVDIMNSGDEVRLKEDLGMTSVGMLYLVIALEETFGVSFDDRSITDFPTLGSVMDYLEKRN